MPKPWRHHSPTITQLSSQPCWLIEVQQEIEVIIAKTTLTGIWEHNFPYLNICHRNSATSFMSKSYRFMSCADMELVKECWRPNDHSEWGRCMAKPSKDVGILWHITHFITKSIRQIVVVADAELLWLVARPLEVYALFSHCVLWFSIFQVIIQHIWYLFISFPSSRSWSPE